MFKIRLLKSAHVLNQDLMRVAELDRKRISLTSDFLLELTTSPQCPTPQPIPVNGLVSEVATFIFL